MRISLENGIKMIGVTIYFYFIVYIFANCTHTLDQYQNYTDNREVDNSTDKSVDNTNHIEHDDSNNNDLWIKWKLLHNKTYTTHKEYYEHYGNWQLNLLSIKEHNIKHKKGLELYATGLNQFSDLNWTRINEVYLTNLSKYSLKPKKKEMILLKYALNKSTDIPSSWDWRTMGVVSGVKLQGECGACWAFSAAGALEGQLNNKTDHFIELSSQQLIDCSQSFGNHGCLGGDMNNAFRYVESNGIQKEENYPYLNKEGRCQHTKSKSIIHSKLIIEVKANDEEELKTVLYEHGPVSAGINVEQQFIRYKTGIYQSSSCSATNVNHAVLIVGYGHENGIDYWIIKNSWGTTWGEDGYVRIRRNYNNMCGVATMASIPKL
uniref:Pept_C1 domain-containing protein n=1 Tax=Trichobilharzia regenti TaxID=157069 RepID=A0AA85JQV3_TRIRE|nr:unnamed protein product [Trichobilharzia regenti]